MASGGYSDTELKRFMDAVADIVDSPKAHLILRNAAATLLELADHNLSVGEVCRLLSDDHFRDDVIEKLSEETPQYWSEQWNSLWKKDAEPLSSDAQQRIARRISLMTFWGREWSGIPAEVRRHVAEAARAMADGGNVNAR